MAYDPGALDMALAAAVGDDPLLIEELRRAFIESALLHLDRLSRSRCDANWKQASWRLKGIAGSFGAVELMRLADEALAGAPGDPVVQRQIKVAINHFAQG
jgi:HPt (histidine-containing phosphotransfer) domain-containing protein